MTCLPTGREKRGYVMDERERLSYEGTKVPWWILFLWLIFFVWAIIYAFLYLIPDFIDWFFPSR